MLHKKNPGKKSTFTEPANYVIIFMYRKQKYQFVFDSWLSTSTYINYIKKIETNLISVYEHPKIEYISLI